METSRSVISWQQDLCTVLTSEETPTPRWTRVFPHDRLLRITWDGLVPVQPSMRTGASDRLANQQLLNSYKLKRTVSCSFGHLLWQLNWPFPPLDCKQAKQCIQAITHFTWGPSKHTWDSIISPLATLKAMSHNLLVLTIKMLPKLYVSTHLPTTSTNISNNVAIYHRKQW